MAHNGLAQAIERMRRRLYAVGTAAGAGRAALAALLLLVAAVWLDLILDLSPPLRIALSLGAALLGAALLAWFISRMIGEAAPRLLARRMDGTLASHGRILSGVELSLAPSPAGPLSAGLAALAVEDAARLAGGVVAGSAIPARPAVRSSAAFAGALFVLALLAMLMPRLAATQWLRFSDPYGDHPPYSPISLQVHPGDVRVVYGDSLDIRAVAGGAPVERVELVMVDAAGQAQERLPMFPEPDGRWRATIASVTAAGRYFVRADSARSHRYAIDVATLPRIEEVRFRITPPAYTNQPPYEGKMPKEGIAGLPGTRVELWARSNRPLAGGSLEFQADDGVVRSDLKAAAESREAAGSFEIAQAGRIQVQVRDVDGQPSKDAFTASVTVLADQRPFVRLLKPQSQSFATPEVVLPIEIAAEDDYGVARVQLFRSLNHSRPLPLDVEVETPPAPRSQITVPLPLSQYGVRAGDVIQLFARVEDNDPAGMKGSESAVVQIQIISQQDFERMMRTRYGMEVLLSKYQQAVRRMEKRAEEIKRLEEALANAPADGELADSLRGALDKLARHLAADAEEVRKAESLDLPYDVDKGLSEQLAKAAEKLEQAAAQASQIASRKGAKPGPTREQLEQLRKQLEAEKQEFQEQASEPLDHLAAIYPLKSDEARFAILYQRQRDLAERMASLKGVENADDPSLKARMRDLEAEQRGLRDALNELLDDIENHARSLPDDPQLDELRKQALDFAAAVRRSPAPPEMQESESGLAEFSGTRGHAGAQAAADALEKFISQCNSMGNQASQCLRFNPSLSACLGSTVEQMLAEAGMGTGNGMMGAGGGYSAASSNLNNVGLYGAMEALGGGRNADAASALGIATSAEGQDAGAPRAMAIDSDGRLRASGAGAAAVPLRYRQRVSAYFQRIADDLDE